MSDEQPPITTIVVPKTDEIRHPTTVETPIGQPDLKIVPLHPAKIIALRAARAYLTCFQGLFAAGITPLDQGVLPADLGDLLWSIAGLSLGAAAASIINNTTELFTALADKYPTLRA